MTTPTIEHVEPGTNPAEIRKLITWLGEIVERRDLALSSPGEFPYAATRNRLAE